jgi:hypothetical protein
VVLGADGHLHPVEREAVSEVPVAEEHRPADPTDSVVAANRERIEELRHERVGSLDMADVMASPEGRVAAVGIALMLVARAFAWVLCGALGFVILAVGGLLFAFYKLAWFVGLAAFRLFDAMRGARYSRRRATR